jgi:hypothetical protein
LLRERPQQESLVEIVCRPLQCDLEGAGQYRTPNSKAEAGYESLVALSYYFSDPDCDGLNTLTFRIMPI